MTRTTPSASRPSRIAWICWSTSWPKPARELASRLGPNPLSLWPRSIRLALRTHRDLRLSGPARVRPSRGRGRRAGSGSERLRAGRPARRFWLRDRSLPKTQPLPQRVSPARDQAFLTDRQPGSRTRFLCGPESRGCDPGPVCLRSLSRLNRRSLVYQAIRRPDGGSGGADSSILTVALARYRNRTAEAAETPPLPAWLARYTNPGVTGRGKGARRGTKRKRAGAPAGWIADTARESALQRRASMPASGRLPGAIA